MLIGRGRSAKTGDDTGRRSAQRTQIGPKVHAGPHPVREHSIAVGLVLG